MFAEVLRMLNCCIISVYTDHQEGLRGGERLVELELDNRQRPLYERSLLQGLGSAQRAWANQELLEVRRDQVEDWVSCCQAYSLCRRPCLQGWGAMLA